jgi:hypothetical protein
VIGGAGQLERAAASDMHELLGARTDFDHPTVFCLEELAVTQWLLAAFQEQADVLAFGTETAQATLAAGLEIQMELGGPFILGFDSLMNHQHRETSGSVRCDDQSKWLAN